MDQKEIVWHGMEELPPHVTKTASKTVICVMIQDMLHGGRK